MPCPDCVTCRVPLHLTDEHHECVSCLDRNHAETAITQGSCSHCENKALSSLRSRLAFFLESDPAPSTLPFPTSQEPRRKKCQGPRTHERMEMSELTPAQTPRASSPKQTSAPPLKRPASSLLVDRRKTSTMTVCRWWPLKAWIGRAQSLTLPPHLSPAKVTPGRAQMQNFSMFSPGPLESLDSTGLHQKSPPEAASTSGSCRGANRPLASDRRRSRGWLISTQFCHSGIHWHLVHLRNAWMRLKGHWALWPPHLQYSN
ncbi:hypothetical protein PO909_010054 [Leuciscus waleckii]